MSLTIKGDPSGILTRIRGALRITEADATFAGNRQKSRILERTRRGVDVDGRPFKPYSTKGPYYYYPNARAGRGFSARQHITAAKRLLRKVNRANPKGARGVQATKSGRGLRFESYAAFKRWLGRTVVDLTGARAPHMLQAIVVRVVGNPATEMRIGIYGSEGRRASGHNVGTRMLPRRRFFGASAADRRAVGQDIEARIAERIKEKR